MRPCRVVTHYVPVNDNPGEVTKPPTATIQPAPQLARDRQPRAFARAWLDEDTVHLVWPDAIPDPTTIVTLRSLAAKVTRIGHSMSLVQMWMGHLRKLASPTGSRTPSGRRFTCG